MRRLALLALLLLLASAAVIALRPGSGYAIQDREAINAGSSRTHPAGTDTVGRDRLTRVACAALLGLAGAVAASTLSTSIAAALGIAAALSPAPVASLLRLLFDLCLSLPWLFLLMMVRSAIPLTTSPVHSAVLTFLLLGLLGWPVCARAVQTGAARLWRAEWLTQGRAAGLTPWRLMRRHMLPHLYPLLLPQLLVSIPACLIAEANLGTLGLGICEPLPSWGSMLLELDNSATLATTHWVLLPIVLLSTTLLLLELLAPQS